MLPSTLEATKQPKEFRLLLVHLDVVEDRIRTHVEP